MSSVPLPGVYHMTYVDWLALPGDNQRYELFEGELIMTPAPSIQHQRVSREVEFRIYQYLRDSAAGEVFDAPVGVRLSDDTVLEPDLAVVLKAHADRIGTQAIQGAPDLVVEILSPGTAKRDLGRKRHLYAQAGVSEYWIVDPEARIIDVLVLEGDRFARHQLCRGQDNLGSRLLPDLTFVAAEVF